MSHKKDKKARFRHDAWLIKEQDSANYAGLNSEEQAFLEKFNQSWTRGAMRTLGKFEPETQEEQRKVWNDKDAARADMLNVATTLPISAALSSPLDALVDAIDLSRDELAIRRRLNNAEKEEAKREKSRQRKQRYREKHRETIKLKAKQYRAKKKGVPTLQEVNEATLMDASANSTPTGENDE